MQPSQASGKTTSRSNFSGWARWLGLIVLFATGFVVRLQCLACKPFWFDETFSVEVARISWGNFLHLLWWREANMSLYYLLLRMWLVFGGSPFFIRSLSVVFAAATIPAIYWLADLLYDRRVALIAAALFTFNAYDVRYAQEARSYALFVLLATLSSAFLIAWLRNPTRQNRVGYVLFSVLAVYAHFYALLLLATHWLALRGKTNGIVPEPNARQLPRSWRIIGVGVAPLLIFVAKTGAGPIRWIQRPDIGDLAVFFERLAGSVTWPLAVILATASIAAVVSLGKSLWSRAERWDVWRCQFLLIWLLFPVALTFVLSFARPVFLSRYMIFCLPALLILAAAGLARLQRAWLIGSAMVVILLLEAQGTAFVYLHDLDNERDASSVAANFILDHAQPADAVLFHIAETRIPYEFARSLRSGENTASLSFAESIGPEIVFPNHGPGLDYRDFTGKPTADLLRVALPAHPRVWVMMTNNGTPEKPDPTTLMLSQVLPEMFPKMQRWQFPKVEVRLYSRE